MNRTIETLTGSIPVYLPGKSRERAEPCGDELATRYADAGQNVRLTF